MHMYMYTAWLWVWPGMLCCGDDSDDCGIEMSRTLTSPAMGSALTTTTEMERVFLTGRGRERNMKGSNILETCGGREGGRERGKEGRRERGREGGREEGDMISQDFSADESATLTFDPIPHLFALGAVQCGLELSLEHAHHHTLVPLEVLVPGLLCHVLGGRGERGGRRREGGEGGERMEGGTGKGGGGEEREKRREGGERVRGRGGATEAC